MEKILQVSGMSKVFEDHNLGALKKEIIRLEKLLNDTSLWPIDADDLQRYKQLDKQHEDLLKVQKTMWRQRSRSV